MTTPDRDRVAAPASENTKETIEDVRGDLHLYEIGEIDLATLAEGLLYSARVLREEAHRAA